MKLEDRTVLITGGASGIGLALASALHQRGNRVVVCGRNEARLAALRARLPGVQTYGCDLGDRRALERLARTVTSDHPGIDLLINNAGIQHNYGLTAGEDRADAIGEEVTINLVAPMMLTALLLPRLLQNSGAAIVNVTSALALAPKASAPVYCATKAAMRSFTQGLRYQLEGTGVAVFELLPALVDTAMTHGRGRGKLSPEAVAAETLRALAADRYEIFVDKARMLYLLHRLVPALARRLVKNS